MAEPRAGLIEMLIPTLDELCADLIGMDASTAIELDSWPAANTFVAAWRPYMPAEVAGVEG
jgi:hypothetical protein